MKFYSYLFYSLFILSSQFLVASYGNLPFLSNLSLSPDGEKIAAKTYIQGKPVIISMNLLNQPTFEPIASLKREDDRVDLITWADDQKILVQTSTAQKARDRTYRSSELFVLDLNGKDFKQIENKSALKKKQNRDILELESLYIFDLLVDDPDHILVSNFDPRENGNAIFKVNLNNLRFEKFESSFQDIEGNRVSNFFAENGIIRYATFYDSIEGTQKVYFRNKKDDDWENIFSFSANEISEDDINIIGLDKNDKNLLIHTNLNSNYKYITKFDPVTKKLKDPIIFQKDSDLSTIDFYENELRSYCFEKFEEKCIYIKPLYTKIMSSLRGIFKKEHIRFVDISKDESKIIFATSYFNSPTQYYYFDSSKKSLKKIGSQYPNIKSNNSKLEFIEYKSRDGFNLYGYLYLPENVSNPPVIVFPHGGPTARDSSMYFDPWLQMMVSEGYAVFQPQFRGSSGWGKNYQISGYKESGKKAQNDVIDGLNFIVQKGYVNGSKSCIVGASYGGYVALTASFQNPKLFKCYISIAGISDFTRLLQSEKFFRGSSKINAIMHGDPIEDKEFLDSVSAINFPSKIVGPVLLIHGTDDTQVPHSQSSDFFQKIKKNNSLNTYVEIKNATHYFDKQKNRQIMFEEIKKFLALNLN